MFICVYLFPLADDFVFYIMLMAYAIVNLFNVQSVY